jgi:hypothetical protein
MEDAEDAISRDGDPLPIPFDHQEDGEKLAIRDAQLAELVTAAKAVLEWAAIMGGWDAKCWEDVRRAVEHGHDQAMALRQWRAKRQWKADLREEIGGDEPIGGFVYPAGWIAKRDDETYWFIIEREEFSFATLDEAEMVLWDKWSRDELAEG